jgi:hypothetical protein
MTDELCKFNVQPLSNLLFLNMQITMKFQLITAENQTKFAKRRIYVAYLFNKPVIIWAIVIIFPNEPPQGATPPWL